MLPHIEWNTPNIVKYATAIRNVLGGTCEYHYVQQSLPADI